MIESKLYRGDCLEVMKQLKPGSVDMVLCDLPYGTTHHEWDTPIDMAALWKSYERVCKPNAAIVLFSAQPFTTDLINSNRKHFKYEIVWEKTRSTGFLDANRKPLKAHENICVFYKGKPTYNPQKSGISHTPKTIYKGKRDRGGKYGEFYNVPYIDDGTRYPTDVIRFDCATRPEHPTEKPVELLAYLIKTYTDAGDLVIDNCMGSGSAGVACAKTGRSFIGIELNEEFYKIAERRIKAETNSFLYGIQEEI